MVPVDSAVVASQRPTVLLVGPGGDRSQPVTLHSLRRLMGRPPARPELPHRDCRQDDGDEPPIFDQEPDEEQSADELPDETSHVKTSYRSYNAESTSVALVSDTRTSAPTAVVMYTVAHNQRQAR